MNYYPFHIGDYIAATRHLSWDEDAAYRRLLDWVYSNEKPLPLDTDKVCRLVVASSDTQRQAVTSVLSEFFDKAEDGWHHTRVDEELAKMREKQEASEERDEHEKTRQQKHRERRAAMFAQLADVGVYPAWNAKTGELERLISERCDKPVTHDSSSVVTAPVTAPVTPATDKTYQQRQPVTAIPTPTPTPTPTPNKEYSHALRVPSADAVDDSKPLVAKDLIAEGVDPQVAADWLKVRKAKKAPLTRTAWDGVKREAALAGMTPAQAVKSATENGWQGFKASWLHGKNGAAGQHQAGNDWTGSAL